MRRSLATAMSLALLAAPLHASAGDMSSSTSSASAISLSPKKLVVDGQVGGWLPMDQIRGVERRLEATDKLEALSAAQKRENDLLVEHVRLAEQSVRTASSAGSEAVRRGNEYKALAEKQAKSIDELNSVWRSPLLWTGVGAAAVVILELVLAAHSGSTVNIQK